MLYIYVCVFIIKRHQTLVNHDCIIPGKVPLVGLCSRSCYARVFGLCGGVVQGCLQTVPLAAIPLLSGGIDEMVNPPTKTEV